MKRLITLAALCLAYPAHAFEIEYPERYDKPARKPQVRAWVQKQQAPKVRPITRTVVVATPAPKVDPRCKPYVVAIGDSAKSEAAAKLEAQKSWKGVVQFEHGNRFLSLEWADNIEYVCSPSSVPRFGGLVESAASKFLPIESMTCRLSAQPCSAPVQREEGK